MYLVKWTLCKAVCGTNAVNFWVNSGPLYSQDRILQAMGNITLAFHLLCERADPNSFWQPYIQTLPSEYDTPLYFEEDEVRYLQSTQAIHDVFSQYKNTARQYAYFYKVIQVSGCWRRGGGGGLSARVSPSDVLLSKGRGMECVFCFYHMSLRCGWNTWLPRCPLWKQAVVTPISWESWRCSGDGEKTCVGLEITICGIKKTRIWVLILFRLF